PLHDRSSDLHDTRDLPVWVTPAPDISLNPLVPIPAPEAEQREGEAQVSPERARAVQVNEAAWQWWRQQASAEGAWVGQYLEGRGLGAATVGQAPAGWTNLVNALGEQGYSTEDMLAAGVA